MFWNTVGTVFEVFAAFKMICVFLCKFVVFTEKCKMPGVWVLLYMLFCYYCVCYGYLVICAGCPRNKPQLSPRARNTQCYLGWGKLKRSLPFYQFSSEVEKRYNLEFVQIEIALCTQAVHAEEGNASFHEIGGSITLLHQSSHNLSWVAAVLVPDVPIIVIHL